MKDKNEKYKCSIHQGVWNIDCAECMVRWTAFVEDKDLNVIGEKIK